jgi:hypothetical protein
MVRVFKSILPADWTSWTANITGTNTITTSGAGDTIATCVNNDGTRPYLSYTLTVQQDYWYFACVRLDTCPAAFDLDSTGDAGLGLSVAVAEGDQIVGFLQSRQGMYLGVKFRAVATASVQFRAGIGIAGNRENGTLVISNVCGYEYGLTEPDFVDKYYDTSGMADFPFSMFTDMEPACVYATGANIAQSAPTVRRALSRYAVIACTGDSSGTGGDISNPTDRYPYEIQKSFDRRKIGDSVGVYNFHVGGEDVFQYGARIASNMAGGDFPADMVADLWVVPKVCVMGSALNSVHNYTAAEILAGTKANISALHNAGVRTVILTGMPAWSNAASYTAGKNDIVIAYNAAISDRYCGCYAYHFRCNFAGDVNTNALSNVGAGDTWDWDSTAFGAAGGDGLHPGAGKYSVSEYAGMALKEIIVAESTRSRGLLRGVLI